MLCLVELSTLGPGEQYRTIGIIFSLLGPREVYNNVQENMYEFMMGSPDPPPFLTDSMFRTRFTRVW